MTTAVPGRDAPEEKSDPVPVVVPDEEDRILLGRDIIAQLGITGELAGVRRMPAQRNYSAMGAAGMKGFPSKAS